MDQSFYTKTCRFCPNTENNYLICISDKIIENMNELTNCQVSIKFNKITVNSMKTPYFLAYTGCHQFESDLPEMLGKFGFRSIDQTQLHRINSIVNHNKNGSSRPGHQFPRNNHHGNLHQRGAGARTKLQK
jgi:hypothetical protein